MITCDRCKSSNLDGGQYCDECGAPLRPNSSSGSGPNVSGMNIFRAEPEGNNGSHSPAEIPQPEVAAGKEGGPAVNLSSSLGASDKPHARLVIERGKSVGKQFMLSSTESNIGRWDADGGIFPDVDLGSTNGTFVNRGKRLPPGTRHTLNDGDEIIVGKTFLRFHVVK